MSLRRSQHIDIEYYNGNLKLVSKLKALIRSEFSEVFYAVIVHGSVATNEVILYSDFDGLLIVKDDYLNSNILEDFRNKAMKLILKFDPLQHHGWFEISKSQLSNYPENYLPVSTLKHSKLIYPEVPKITLKLEVVQKPDYKSSFAKMLAQFEKRASEGWKPKNSYQLKGFLSQIMLFPCLHYSAVHNGGIFKRDSFEAVRTDFTEDEWMPITIATELRSNWTYKTTWLQRYLLGQTNNTVRKITTRFLAPKIHSNFKKDLNAEFYNNLSLLVKKLKKDI